LHGESLFDDTAFAFGGLNAAARNAHTALKAQRLLVGRSECIFGKVNIVKKHWKMVIQQPADKES